MKRILIVDDEKSFAMALKEGFSRHRERFLTDVAFNAENAIQLIMKYPYRVVISDIRLPGMSGVDLLLALGDWQPNTAFIAMTAFSSPAVEQQIRELGGFNYVEKPVEFKELEALVLKYVSCDSNPGSILQSFELSSVAQLINVEGKTLVLSVTSTKGKGLLSFRKGELHDATFLNLKGEDAALAMFSLSSCDIRIALGKRVGQKTIETPLMNLLMQAMKEKDERNKTPGENASERMFG